ncbi:MAG: hypothetical protein H7Y32_21420 [Chloroflexales bacterium]|nr:hypothetical protein [Chloroflexales bacterium]
MLRNLQTRWKVGAGFVVLAGLIAIGAVPLRRQFSVRYSKPAPSRKRPARRRKR